MTKVVLTDIEGTTTSISFVHDVLFQYSAKEMRVFIGRHKTAPAVQQLLKKIDPAFQPADASAVDKVTTILLDWIAQDKKHPVLKNLQGMIWEDGYKQGAFKSHLYDDVEPQLRQWKQQGLRLAIFSSGSAEAQRLLFGHTPHGDLTDLFEGFFDLAVGGKREKSSYLAIASKLNVEPRDILFLSDVVQELDAAKDAGLQTIQLVRPGTVACNNHPTATTFDDINP
jgi:enolase-phosphatase E1